MLDTHKNWNKRSNVTIDSWQIDLLKRRAKRLGITYTHLVRIIIQSYVDNDINIDNRLPDWTKEY